MYPRDVTFFAFTLSIWNFTFLLGVLAGYPMLLRALRARRVARRPTLLTFRWLLTVYGSAVGAQLFAYAFDLNTGILPPPSVSWVRYYLDPLYGPKMLYGAIVFLPLTLLLVAGPRSDLDYATALDCWTPPLFAVVGIARVGCFLQGCCYGVTSDRFGISFPPYGTVYYRQLDAGIIVPGSATLPVVPTQAIEAVLLFGLCAWSLRKLREGGTSIFPPAVALYSVFRFVIEFVRDDPDRNFLGPLSTSQWVACAVLVVYGLWRLASSRMSARTGAYAFPR